MAIKLNCWEALKCNKTQCPAYLIPNNKCWLISNTLCYNNCQDIYISKISLCLDCKVFNKNITLSSLKETLRILSKQITEYRYEFKEQKNKIEIANRDFLTALLEFLEMLERISKGEYSRRISLKTNNPLLIELTSKLNSFAEGAQKIAEDHRELLADVSRHCETLNRIAGGDYFLKASEDSRYEIAAHLGRQINKVVDSRLKLPEDQKTADDKAESYIQNLQDIIEFLPDATFAIDNDKKVIAWNKAIENMTGTKKSNIIGKADYAYAIPFYGYKRPILIDLLNASAEDIEKTYETIKRKSDAIFAEVYIPSLKGGDGAHIWAIASPLFDRDGYKIGAIESIRDMTEFKEKEKMIIDVNEKLRLWANDLEQRTRDLVVLNEMGELIQTCVSIDDAYGVISQSMLRFFPSFSGCIYMLSDSTNELVIVSKWGDELKCKNSFNPPECWALRRNRMHLSKKAIGYLRCKHLSKEFSGDYICIPLIAQGDAIGLLHLQMSKEQTSPFDLEMTESRQQLAVTIAEHISLNLYNIKLRETLKYQAVRDPLTGLFNRRYMEETLERELQRTRRSKSTIGLIMFDIDHFKRFNDSFGHEAGDTMLRQIALFIKSNIRAEDIASRYGGEEFIITMPDASLMVTKERAEKLRREVKNLHVEHGRQHLGNVTLSFGVAVFPTHAKNWELLIKAADTALYKAKAEGRDKVVVAEKIT